MKSRNRLSAGMICLLLSLTPLRVEAEVVPWKNVSDWDISYYDNANGCLAYADYEGGMSFFIGLTGLDSALVFEITLLSEAWKSIESGKE